MRSVVCAVLALTFWTCVAAPAAAREERGAPILKVYPAEEHKAGPQNFDIAQDDRGILYFGNLAGLLTFDGAWWRLLKLPDDQAALAVASNDRGRVVVGMVDDFGYLDGDGTGTTQFRSLMPLVPAEAREFGEVRAICSTSAGFLLVTERRLLLWDGARGVRASAEHAQNAAPRGCFASDDLLLYGRAGLQRLDLAGFRVAPAGISGRVDAVLRSAGGALIAAVRDEGLVTVENGVTRPYAAEASAFLKQHPVSSGVALADGRLVITTRQHGLVIVARDGQIEQLIDGTSGLPDAILAAAFVDREGALWLGMEGPVVRIDLTSPVSLFDARRGLNGAISDVARYDGRLYAASSHGLFVFDENGVASRVEAIDTSVWRLLPFDGELLVATSKGLYRIRGNAAPEQILTTEGEIYDVVRSPSDPSRIWLAMRSGLGRMRRHETSWADEGLMPFQREYLTTIVEQDGVLWCGTVFDGVLRILDPRGAMPRVTQFGTGEMNVFRAGGRVVFVRATGEILNVSEAGRLVPDPLLGHVRAPRSFFLMAEDARGNVWINSTPPRMVPRLANGRYAEEGQPLVSVTAADLQCLRTSADGVVWFGGDRGLFRYEPTAAPRALAQPAPLVRRVVAGANRLVFGGETSRHEGVQLRHNQGRLRIEFAPGSFRPGVEYQYRLDPSDSGWSAWTEEPFIDYTNLDASDYTFRIRARGAGTTISGESQWRFSVLPPWYRTAWAYVAWGLIAIALVASIIALRTRALRRQAEKLRARVTEQTNELRHKNELLEQANARLESLSMLDELTGIANRRFFEKALADEWSRALRREEPLALVLLDLDHFKMLNDRRGHRAGDECLRHVGRLLGETIRRSGEVVARYGGEEFAVLLPGTDLLDATRVAERLRHAIERLDIVFDDGLPWRITASCGVATIVPRLTDSIEGLVDRADRALYAAKHAGRNTVRVAREEDEEDDVLEAAT